MGRSRLIYILNAKLKNVQRWILHNILSKAHTHENCYGLKQGHSILKNVWKDYVCKIY